MPNFYAEREIIPVTNQFIYHGDAAPTTGIFEVGDFVVNSAPGPGKPLVWACTAKPLTFGGAGFLPNSAIVGASATYVATVSDRKLLVNNGGSARGVTLPAASAFPTGVELTISRLGSAAVTITPTGSDKINNQVTCTLTAQYSTVNLISDGVSNWYIAAASLANTTP